MRAVAVVAILALSGCTFVVEGLRPPNCDTN